MKEDISLRMVERSHPCYQEIRSRHYVPNHGSVGQQLHYLILYQGMIIGIISGGSAVYSVSCRDDYFGINKENRRIALNGIINNTVYRLEQRIPNIGTQILSMWRKRCAEDWEARYGVVPCGYETFIVEEPYRKGSMYKADNWTFVGETAGSTKVHSHGINNKSSRVDVLPKLVYCKWIKGRKLPTEYFPTWQNPNLCKGQLSLFDMEG